MTMKQFFKAIISSKDPSSAKRFITLIVAFHFIVSSFTVLFIAAYVVFYLPKGKVDINLLDVLKDILKDDLIIITSGLGFITVEGATRALVEMYKNKNFGGYGDNFMDRYDRGDRIINDEGFTEGDITDKNNK